MNIKKMFLVIILFQNILIYAVCEEKINLIKDGLSLLKPGNVITQGEIPEFKDYDEKVNYLNKKYCMIYYFVDENDMRKMRSNEFSDELKELLKKDKVNEVNLISILTKDKIVLSDYLPMADLIESLNHINSQGKLIGEKYFAASSDGLLSPPSYGFIANIIINNKILNLNLVYYDLDFEIVKNSKYFEKRGFKDGNEYYWKTDKSKLELYQDIISGENSEEIKPLILLNKYWEQIIKSIEIVDRKGILNDSKVRIRKEPNLDGEQLGYLNKGQKVSILEETDQKMKIGEMDAVWYKVETEDGVVGWAYGWFIDIVNE